MREILPVSVRTESITCDLPIVNWQPLTKNDGTRPIYLESQSRKHLGIFYPLTSIRQTLWRQMFRLRAASCVCSSLPVHLKEINIIFEQFKRLLSLRLFVRAWDGGALWLIIGLVHLFLSKFYYYLHGYLLIYNPKWFIFVQFHFGLFPRRQVCT